MFNNILFGGNERTIYQKRTGDIKQQLEKNDITASVFRTTIFNTEYYVIAQVDDKQCWNEVDICKALDIPRNWVDLEHYCGMRAYFIIYENKLHNLYGNKDSRLDFTKKKQKISFSDSTEDMFNPSDFL